jgi:phenylacetate-CoA ligase
MNPLSNPLFLLRLTHNYLNGVDRLKKKSEKEVRDYQDKYLKKIVRYAYNVPLYHNKYKKIGLHPTDINGIDDIKKIPIITKNDLRNSSYEMLIHSGKKINSFSKVTTSGSSGRPVTIFSDPYTIFQTFIGFIRCIREYDISWRKNKIAIIADLSQDSAEYAYFSKIVMPSLKSLFSLNNIKIFHIGDKPEKIFGELESFNPDFIGGYPGILKILAIYKKKDKNENLSPKVIASSGAILDDYTRKYIKNSFNAKIFDVYGATECSPIAFECQKGNIHLNSDFVFMEFLDSNEKKQLTEDGGNIIVTRLFGRGTPIIRYSGLCDFIYPDEKKCNCDINSKIIKKIGGRQVDSIILSNGDIIPPSSITGIPYHVMNKYRLDIIQQFQIIQHEINNIEILFIIDKNHFKKGLKEKIFKEIKIEFYNKLGKDVKIRINEVEKIENIRKNSYTPPPVVLSKMKMKL